MKKFNPVFPLITTLFLSSFAVGQSVHKNDLAKENLKGQVKTLTETWYNHINKKPAAQGKKISSFNSNGFLIKEIYTNPDGSFLQKTYYTYESNNHLISSNDTFPGMLLDILISSYRYDDKGNLVEQLLRNARGNIVSSETYKYDDNGNVIEEGSLDSAGVLMNKEISSYDSKGKLAGYRDYDSNGKLIDNDTILYNSRGDEVEHDKNNTEMWTLPKSTYRYNKYDKEGNWLMRTEYSDNKLVETRERTIEYY